MAGKKTDASVAFSVTDNVSESVTKMRSAMLQFKDDAEGLQQRLETLENTRVQLKYFDLTEAKDQLTQAKKALEELGDAATEADRETARANFDTAARNYENVRNQLSQVSTQVKQTTQDLLDSTGAITRVENRAGTGRSSLLGALGTAGLLDMAGDAALEITNAAVSSALGSSVGGIASSAIGGAVSRAAMGSLLGPTGMAAGAAIGGTLGLVQGAVQDLGNRDQAFIDYYTGVYDAVVASQDENKSQGIDTAAQRELDAINFDTLLNGKGDEFLADLRQIAAETPFEYSDLTSMATAMATGFSDSPDRILELITAVGDAGASVGASASDMEWMARALSRMQNTGVAQLGEIDMFENRGIGVLGMLSDALGISKDEVRSKISSGEIEGGFAVDVIQAGLEQQYGGAMEVLAQTYEGLSSTLSDTMTEIAARYGEGYNDERTQGYQAEIDAYGGALGEAMGELNRIIGQNDAYLENLGEQYTREARSAVLLGSDTSLFSKEDQADLEELSQSYQDAKAEFEATGSESAALQMESAIIRADAIAQFAYENSEQYRLVQEAEERSLEALRTNTSATEANTAAYNLQQSRSKGGIAGMLDNWVGLMSSTWGLPAQEAVDTIDEAVGSPWAQQDTPSWAQQAQEAHGHAAGLYRVPYDNYPAILHQNERVLTAREAREEDNGTTSRPIQITVSGNTFGADLTAEAVAEALADAIAVKLAAGYGGG